MLLAQVLVGGADLLLLDEPTNHLDILSIRWLEKFLDAYAGCAVVISHDQRFLDNVTTHTLDVDYRTITLYTGSYSTFERDKAAIREQKETGNQRALEEIARKRAFVERFGAKNTKATQAQSRLKQIERIEVEELVPSSRRTPVLRFEPARPSGREVLEVAGLSKAYGPKRVLSDVSLIVRRGERVAVIGPNGLGKSTLLKIAVDRLAPDAGNVRWGHEARVGYFPQDHREVLDRPRGDGAGHRVGGVSRAADHVRAQRPGAGAVLGRGRGQAHRHAVGRRGGAADLRPAGGRAAQRAGAGRAHQPPGHRGHPRAGGGAARVPGHGAVRVPRPLVRVRAGHAHRGADARRGRGTSPAATPSTSRSAATTTWTPTRSC